MYQAGDSEADKRAAAALGWDVDGEESGPDIEVFPDTLESVLVFDKLGSQWIYAGMGGVPTGIVYASIEPVLRRSKVPAERWDDMFEDIRVMEAAALQEMHEQAKRRTSPK